MKISRIALASLISFGVLGGASLNASASHHSHYQRILWNKTMSHHKVALKKTARALFGTNHIRRPKMRRLSIVFPIKRDWY